MKQQRMTYPIMGKVRLQFLAVVIGLCVSQTQAYCLNGQDTLPNPGSIPAPGETGDGPYSPNPILPGGIVIPLYGPDSSFLNQEKVKEAEVYNMTKGVPGRIQSIVNIHNPSIEIHTVDPGINTGAVVILVAGGGHRTLNVGTESGDFVPYFYNYGVNCVILRNRLRSDGYDAKIDAVNDSLQAIRLVRKNAERWGYDPNKIGIIGFSAGAELTSTTAVQFKAFDDVNNGASDPLAGVSSRPDFVGVIYPGPTPFTQNPETAVPPNSPPSFIASAGTGDRGHAIWAMDYYRAMLNAGIPNIEMHLYGNGDHGGGQKHRAGIPFGTWQTRYIEWFSDLGFLQRPGEETKAAKDIEAKLNRPPRRRRGS